MLRVILFLSIIFLIINHFFVLAGLVFVWYLIRYGGYELVVAGILLDGYYGAFNSVPIIAIGSFLLWIFVNSIKDSQLLYTGKNETFS